MGAVSSRSTVPELERIDRLQPRTEFVASPSREKSVRNAASLPNYSRQYATIALPPGIAHQENPLLRPLPKTPDKIAFDVALAELRAARDVRFIEGLTSKRAKEMLKNEVLPLRTCIVHLSSRPNTFVISRKNEDGSIVQTRIEHLSNENKWYIESTAGDFSKKSIVKLIQRISCV